MSKRQFNSYFTKIKHHALEINTSNLEFIQVVYVWHLSRKSLA